MTLTSANCGAQQLPWIRRLDFHAVLLWRRALRYPEQLLEHIFLELPPRRLEGAHSDVQRRKQPEVGDTQRLFQVGLAGQEHVDSAARAQRERARVLAE